VLGFMCPAIYTLHEIRVALSLKTVQIGNSCDGKNSCISDTDQGQLLKCALHASTQGGKKTPPLKPWQLNTLGHLGCHIV